MGLIFDLFVYFVKVPLLCVSFKRQRKENVATLTPWAQFNEQSPVRAFPSLEEYEAFFFFQSEALSDLSHNISFERVERNRTVRIKR